MSRALPLGGLLVTAVHKEGQMGGVDLPLMQEVARVSRHRVYASGGVTTLEDLKALADTGGFGCSMLMAHNWANSRATADSYELIARHVVPHFQGMNVNREVSIEELIARRAQEKAGQHGFDKAVNA